PAALLCRAFSLAGRRSALGRPEREPLWRQVAHRCNATGAGSLAADPQAASTIPIVSDNCVKTATYRKALQRERTFHRLFRTRTSNIGLKKMEPLSSELKCGVIRP